MQGGKGVSYNSAPVRKEELNEKSEEDLESVSPKVMEEEGRRYKVEERRR